MDFRATQKTRPQLLNKHWKATRGRFSILLRVESSLAQPDCTGGVARVTQGLKRGLVVEAESDSKGCALCLPSSSVEKGPNPTLTAPLLLFHTCWTRLKQDVFEREQPRAT